MGQIVVIREDEMSRELLDANLSFFLGRSTVSFPSLGRMARARLSDCSAFVLASGKDEIAVIRTLWPGVPIVACCSLRTEEADAFVRFPCDPREEPPVSAIFSSKRKAPSLTRRLLILFRPIIPGQSALCRETEAARDSDMFLFL